MRKERQIRVEFTLAELRGIRSLMGFWISGRLPAHLDEEFMKAKGEGTDIDRKISNALARGERKSK